MMSFADNVARLWGREWNRPHKKRVKKKGQVLFPITFSFDILLFISFLFSLLHRGEEPRCHTAKHDTRQPANSETSSETSLVRHDGLRYFWKPLAFFINNTRCRASDKLTSVRLLNLILTRESDLYYRLQMDISAYVPDCLLFTDKVARKMTVSD